MKLYDVAIEGISTTAALAVTLVFLWWLGFISPGPTAEKITGPPADHQGIVLNEDILCGEPGADCDLGKPVPLVQLLDLRAKAAYWEGYAAGLEQCGPMLGIKKQTD